MATEVDNRVVQMTFNNAQFEKGVDKTLKTIDKLNKALKFEDASKGFEDIQNAADSINLHTIADKVDSLANRFSAFGIMGMQVWSRIGNAAIDFVTGPFKTVINGIESGIDAVTNQVKTGGWNRALNLEQAEFLIEGLGYAWEKGGPAEIIKEDGEEIANIYNIVDEAVTGTAYSLDEAAKVAGSLLTSNVNAEDGTLLGTLRAISGVAAMTSSDFASIGDIFGTIAGQGKLMTMQLRQLESRGLNAAAILADALGTDQAAVREMVTEGEIDFETFSMAMEDAFGDKAQKANETFTGSLSNVKSALSRIGARFAEPLLKNLIEPLNEARILINQFGKALDNSNITSYVEKAFGAASQKILNLFTYKVKDGDTEIMKLKASVLNFFYQVEKIGNGLRAGFSAIGKIFTMFKESWDEVFGKKPADAFVKRAESIRDALYSINHRLKYDQPLIDKIKETFKGILIVVRTVLKVMKSAIKLVGKVAGIVAKLVVHIIHLGAKMAIVIDKFVKWIKETKAFKKTTETIKKVIDTVSTSVSKFSSKIVDTVKNSKILERGLKLLKGIMKTFANFIVAIIKVIHGAFEGLYKVFHDFIPNSRFVKKGVELIKKAFDSIKKSIGIATESVRDWAKEKFDNFSYTDVRDSIVEFFTGTLPDKIHEFGEKLHWAFSHPKEAFEELLDKMKTFEEKVKGGFLDVVGDLKEKFGNAKDAISDFSNDDSIDVEKTKKKISIFETLSDALTTLANGFRILKDILGGVFTSLFEAFKEGFDYVKGFASDLTFEDFVKLIGVALDTIIKYNWAKAGADIASFFKQMSTAIATTRRQQTTLKLIPEALVKIAASILILAFAFGKFAELNGEEVTKASGALIVVAAAIWIIISAISKIANGTQKSATELQVLDKASLSLSKMADKALANISNGFAALLKFAGVAAVIFSVGVVIGTVVVAIMALAKVLDTVDQSTVTQVEEIVTGIFIAIGALIAGILYFLAKMPVTTGTGKILGTLGGIAALLFALSASIGIVVTAIVALAIIGSIGEGKYLDTGLQGLFKVVVVMAVMLMLVTAVSHVIGREGGGGFGQLVGIAALVAVTALALIVVAGVILLFAVFDGDKMHNAIIGVCAVLLTLGLVMGIAAKVANDQSTNVSGSIGLIIVSAIAIAALMVAFSTMIDATKGMKLGQFGMIVGAIILMAVIMLALGYLSGKMLENKSDKDMAATIGLVVAMAAAIFILAAAVKVLSSADIGLDTFLGVFVIVLLLAAFSGLAFIVSKAPAVEVAMTAIGTAVLAFGAGVFLLVAALYLLGPAMSFIAENYDELSSKIESVTQLLVDLIFSFIDNFGQALKRKASQLIYTLGDIILAIIIGIVAFLKGRSMQIGVAIGDFFFAIIEIIGYAIIRLCDNIVKSFKEALGINSPAKEMEPVGTGLVEGIILYIFKKAQKMWDAIGEFVNDYIIKPIKEFFEDVWKLGGDLIDNFIGGLESMFPNAMSAIEGFISDVLSAFDGVKETVLGVFDEIFGEGDRVSKKLDETLRKREEAKQAEEAGHRDKTLIDPYVDQIEQYKKSILEAQSKITNINAYFRDNPVMSDTIRKDLESSLATQTERFKDAYEALKNVYEKADYWGEESWGQKGTHRAAAYQVGQWIGTGYKLGVYNSIGGVNYLSGIVGNQVDTLKSSLGIASPSKVFMQIGEFMIQGLDKGLTDEFETTGKILSSFAESISSFDTDIESPTITPVLDLTEIQNGANQISAMMSNQKAQVLASMDIKRSDVRNGERLNDLTEAVNHLTIKTDSMDISGELGVQSGLLGQIIDALANQNVVLDSGALVGGITTKMDKALGARSIAVGRRAY